MATLESRKWNNHRTPWLWNKIKKCPLEVLAILPMVTVQMFFPQSPNFSSLVVKVAVVACGCCFNQWLQTWVLVLTYTWPGQGIWLWCGGNPSDKALNHTQHEGWDWGSNFCPHTCSRLHPWAIPTELKLLFTCSFIDWHPSYRFTSISSLSDPLQHP